MISIVIPLYNQVKKLDKCLGSIKKQNYENYEVLVVNDRSTEPMSWLMKKWRDKMGVNIEFFHNQINHGAPYARNKGFRHSNGEFVLFCDADLILERECLSEMIGALRNHPEASYAYSSHMYGHKLFRCFPFDAERLKQMPYIHTTSLLRKKDFPKDGFDETLKRLQDWDLWLTMLKNGKTGVFINRVLFKVQTGGTMSRWVPKTFYKLFPFLSTVKKYKEAMKIIKKKHSLT